MSTKRRKKSDEPPPFAAPDWPATRVEMWPLAKIIAYKNNPRTHPQSQIDQLAKSMREDGVTMPILVDEHGIIIAGHGRLLGAQANKFEEYPVVIARGWSEEQKRAARLKDNQIALLSGWDFELIKAEIGNLKLAGFDVQLLGFPESQLRGWGISAGTDSGQDPEATPERPKKPVVRKGDLWVLGDHRILCGDCTSAKDVETSWGGARPNLMVTDPPYGVDYDPDWRNRADRANGKPYGASAIGTVKNDHRSDWTAAWKLYSGDVAYCWHADRHASSTQRALESVGFVMRAQIIWAKTRLIIGRGDYHVQHEPCWYVVRKGKRGNWQGGRSQTTRWDIAHPKSDTGHSTQKPIECMKRPIENNSRKGDHVYDPFVGSGTTIISCEMTGRKCLAIELDPGYVQVGIERWEKFTGRKALLDGRTLDQVAKARQRGLPLGESYAKGHSGKSVPGQDPGGNGAERGVRPAVHARRPAPRRKPAGEPPPLARDS